MGNYISSANFNEADGSHADCEKNLAKFNTPVGFRHIPKSFDPRSPTEGIDRTPLLVQITPDERKVEDEQVVMSDPRSPSVGVDRTPLVFKTQDLKLGKKLVQSLVEVSPLVRSVKNDQIMMSDPRSPPVGFDRTPLVFKTQDIELENDSENVLSAVPEEKKVLEDLFDSFSSLEISSLEKPVSSDASDSTPAGHQISDSLRVEPPSGLECTFTELEEVKREGTDNTNDLSVFPDSIITSTPIKTTNKNKKTKFDKENDIIVANQKSTPRPYKRTPLADKKQNFDSPRVQLQYQQKTTARVLMQRNSQ